MDLQQQNCMGRGVPKLNSCLSRLGVAVVWAAGTLAWDTRRGIHLATRHIL